MAEGGRFGYKCYCVNQQRFGKQNKTYTYQYSAIISLQISDQSEIKEHLTNLFEKTLIQEFEKQLKVKLASISACVQEYNKKLKGNETFTLDWESIDKKCKEQGVITPSSSKYAEKQFNTVTLVKNMEPWPLKQLEEAENRTKEYIKKENILKSSENYAEQKRKIAQMIVEKMGLNDYVHPLYPMVERIYKVIDQALIQDAKKAGQGGVWEDGLLEVYMKSKKKDEKQEDSKKKQNGPEKLANQEKENKQKSTDKLERTDTNESIEEWSPMPNGLISKAEFQSTSIQLNILQNNEGPTTDLTQGVDFGEFDVGMGDNSEKEM